MDQQFRQAIFTKLLASSVFGLRYSVGEGDQQVSTLKVNPGLLERKIREHADSHSVRLQSQGRAAANQYRGQMTGIRVKQPALPIVVNTTVERRVFFRGTALV